MKVVVTGANGCIGQAVVKTLAEKGHEVAAIDFTYARVNSG